MCLHLSLQVGMDEGQLGEALTLENHVYHVGSGSCLICELPSVSLISTEGPKGNNELYRPVQACLPVRLATGTC